MVCRPYTQHVTPEDGFISKGRYQRGLLISRAAGRGGRRGVSRCEVRRIPGNDPLYRLKRGFRGQSGAGGFQQVFNKSPMKIGGDGGMGEGDVGTIINAFDNVINMG